MKTKIILAILLVFTTGIASYSQISKAEIVATGLTCSMCSNAINKQLKAIPEVENVATDLNTNTFTVTLQKDSKITPFILKQSVEKAGFFVGSMIITLQIDLLKTNDNGTINQQDSTYVLIDQESRHVPKQITAKIVNKGFVTQKEFKRLAKSLAKYQSSTDIEKTYYLKLI